MVDCSAVLCWHAACAISSCLHNVYPRVSRVVWMMYVQQAIELALEEYVSRTAKACSTMATAISPEEPKKAVFEEDELNSINKEGVSAANRVFYAECVRVWVTEPVSIAALTFVSSLPFLSLFRQFDVCISIRCYVISISAPLCCAMNVMIQLLAIAAMFTGHGQVGVV